MHAVTMVRLLLRIVAESESHEALERLSAVHPVLMRAALIVERMPRVVGA